MRSTLRLCSLLLAPALLLTLTPPVHAASLDETLPDAQMIEQMELRAQQAKPRDQCYLYTELVHTMTNVAIKQIANGDDDKASATLRQVNRYAHLIASTLLRNTKKLKNAEILMDRTTDHLTQALHLTSGEQRTNVQATLKQLNVVQDQLLNQVFSH